MEALCSTNAKVAEAAKQPHLAQTWRILALLFSRSEGVQEEVGSLPFETKIEPQMLAWSGALLCGDLSHIFLR